MKPKCNLLQSCLLGAVLLVLPVTVQAQFAYTNADGSIYGYSTNSDDSVNIDSYTGPPWVVMIPTNINGMTVTSIGDYAFSGTTLINVFVPKSITNLYSTAFNECSSLTNITVDAQNPAYSSLAGVLFDKNQMKLIDYPCGMVGSYTVPESVTSIGDFAFPFCLNLTNIIIPDSVTNIGQYAFYACSGLVNFTIPTNVTTIGQYAFADCAGLTNIFIPSSVTNIGIVAFGYCPLNAIIVATNNPAYSSVAGVLFDSSQTTLVEFPSGKAGTYFNPKGYTIPDGVIRIGDWAFAGCSLINIFIPNSVTRIGSGAFDECTRLANLTIPDSVINIGSGAFEATSLANIIIPASVTTLGWFGSCPNLRSVYFQGNAPGQGNGIPLLSFLEDATAYYLPGTTGWAEYFQITSLPTVLWNPQAQTGDENFGVLSNQFGFNITGSSNLVVVVEACTNLANPVWTPVATNTLNAFIGTNGMSYFSDPRWTNYPSRFYGFSWP
jgi:hypothetical protein